MTPQEELIAETEGLKAVVTALVGMVTLIGGQESNLKEKLYAIAIDAASKSTVDGPGIDKDAVAARSLATVDGIFSKVNVSFR